jgi:hypothetical protein
MKTVYAVTEGCYDDYHVVALFSTRELAKQFISVMEERTDTRYDEFNPIEEIAVDPPVVDMLQRGYTIWSVYMLRDGETERVKTHPYIGTYAISTAGHADIVRRTKMPAYQETGAQDILMMDVWAKTEQDAIKVVDEKRVQLIYAGKW